MTKIVLVVIVAAFGVLAFHVRKRLRAATHVREYMLRKKRWCDKQVSNIDAAEYISSVIAKQQEPAHKVIVETEEERIFRLQEEEKLRREKEAQAKFAAFEAGSEFAGYKPVPENADMKHTNNDGAYGQENLARLSE